MEIKIYMIMALIGAIVASSHFVGRRSAATSELQREVPEVKSRRFRKRAAESEGIAASRP